VKKYEGMFIFHPMADDQLEEKINKASEEITKVGGTVGGITRMGRSSFARPMHKKDAGIYVLMAFELDPLQVDSLRKRYRLHEDLIRVQVFLASERRAPQSDTPRDATDASA
jgi:ribosomal protein S6